MEAQAKEEFYPDHNAVAEAIQKEMAQFNPDEVLLGYQKRWIADDSPLKIAEKSRRTGLTWGEAADAVLSAAAARSAGGTNHFYVGSQKEMAREFIDAAAMWAKAFGKVASEIQEEVFRDEDAEKDILTFAIYFDSGFKIQALSSNPSNLRGMQGNVTIDEAAFHDRLAEVLKAALALTMWGAKVRLISTHNGIENLFNELITDSRAGKKRYSVHRLTIEDACKEGLYKRICQIKGMEWSQEAEDEWLKNLLNDTATEEDALEEYFCIPKSGGGAYLSRALIEARMAKEPSQSPVVYLEKKNDFAEWPEHLRADEIKDWCEENLLPILNSLDQERPHVFGEDFARSGDLTVIPIGEIAQDMHVTTKLQVELKNIPFSQQEQILFYIVDRLPRLCGGAMDARGNGQALAEAAKASALQAAKADSNLNNNVTENNVTRIARPKGGSFQKDGFNLTGAIKVQLPVFFTSSMVSFYVDVFEYRSGKSFSVYVSGHNDAGSKKWHSVTAKIVGDEASNYTVRAGHENNKCCFWIAELSSKFNYPSITVRDVQISFASYDIALWDDSWSVALVSNFGVIQNELRGNVVGNNIAQLKTAAAQEAAQNFAQAKANLAEVKAKVHADGKVTDAEARAIAVAQQKSDIARAQAIIAASDDTTTKANTAKTQAVEDIALGNFIAQLGLIKKLIANQALMNQVIAQFGQFGGLAAEAIAAKAVSTDKLHLLARSLVNNFSHTGERTGWSGNFPLVDHVHKGQTIKAMEVATRGSVMVTSEWFDIDHTKMYEVNFTFYRVSGDYLGARYFGMYADNGAVSTINPVGRNHEGDTSNFYFWSGDVETNSTQSIKGYIIGSEVNPHNVPESDYVICKLKPGCKKVRLRALNYYNNGSTTVDRWINPSVTELGSGTITARQLIATQALFNIVKAQFAKFGGLTANELKVDNAFINKLISNRGLFDELKSRIAIFGGLTANEIATGAVKTEHLAVG